MVQHIDQAYKPILDRDQGVEMSENFNDVIELLYELVDYGTNLIPRTFYDSPRDLKAICLLFDQAAQFVMHLDGITQLITSGAARSSNLQLRSLIETAHRIEWILATNSEAKVQYLYVANLRHRRHAQSIALPGTPEADRHNAMGAPALKLTAEQSRELATEVERIDEILSRPPFALINTKFERHYAKKGFDQPWYKVYGVPSIRAMATELKHETEYRYFYSVLSRLTHGSDLWKSVSFGRGKVQVSPIREPQHIPQIAQLSAIMALRVYRLLLKEYRAGEEENLARKYMQEWRERFWKRYQIDINPQQFTI
jgi:hypothetical protein